MRHCKLTVTHGDAPLARLNFTRGWGLGLAVGWVGGGVARLTGGWAFCPAMTHSSPADWLALGTGGLLLPNFSSMKTQGATVKS